MAVTVDWATKVITVPQADLTLVSGTLYSMDTEAFHLEIIALLDDEVGMPFVDILRHVTETTIAGTTYARFLEIINGYTIEFEDGQYAVRLDGSNNNFFDEGVIVRNQVSVISTNSAGLVKVSEPFAPDEVFMGVTYDESGTEVTIGFWLERNGDAVAAPTSGTLTWYNPNGTVLFSDSDLTPDSQGHFHITYSGTLDADTNYYAVAAVTDSEGTVTTHRSLPTAT